MSTLYGIYNECYYKKPTDDLYLVKKLVLSIFMYSSADGLSDWALHIWVLAWSTCLFAKEAIFQGEPQTGRTGEGTVPHGCWSTSAFPVIKWAAEKFGCNLHNEHGYYLQTACDNKWTWNLLAAAWASLHSAYVNVPSFQSRERVYCAFL